MADLKTSYLGMELDNPVIIASSRLTSTLDGLKKCEDAGAGAVVIKSLFEEQIDSESNEMINSMEYFSHTDAYDFFANRSRDYYIDTYLETVEKAKKSLNIPVIASVNCKKAGTWIEYAGRFESVGADALELNIFVIPSDVNSDSSAVEQVYTDILQRVKHEITIPVALKIGPHFSGMANFMRRLDKQGSNGLVVFNRFYKTDIDIESMELKPGKIISVPEEAALTLQWVALMSGELDADVCASTGIHDGNMLIKQLLAGANAVQVCSTVMKNGYGIVNDMKSRLNTWMDEKGFSSINDFRGMLSQEQSETPEIWERSQYIKAICGIS